MDDARLAAVAGLLANGTRAAVCCALLDGRPRPAGELACAAEVSASTMSEHLSRLVAGGLLVERRRGRRREVSLAGAHVAAAIEQLLALAAPGPPPRSLRAVSAAAALRRARTCYDHLAGRLGVTIGDALVSRGVLDVDFSLTAHGRTWLDEHLGIAAVGGRRPVTRPCLDWTERRPHLAGRVGAELCAELQARRWVRRIGTGRAVLTTAAGNEALHELLGIDHDAWVDG